MNRAVGIFCAGILLLLFSAVYTGLKEDIEAERMFDISIAGGCWLVGLMLCTGSPLATAKPAAEKLLFAFFCIAVYTVATAMTIFALLTLIGLPPQD